MAKCIKTLKFSDSDPANTHVKMYTEKALRFKNIYVSKKICTPVLFVRASIRNRLDVQKCRIC